MPRFPFLIALATAMIVMIAPQTLRAKPAESSVQARPSETARSAGRHAINGVDYDYESYGEGEPLLLHGRLGSIDMYAPILPILAANRQVIAVDLHGHGRTGLGERPVEMADIGADLAVLVNTLGGGWGEEPLFHAPVRTALAR